MKMLPLFENTLGVKLNNIPIQCIVKSQDYNNLAFHKVSKLFMKDEKEYGSRKILAFFLLNPEIYPDIFLLWRIIRTQPML